MKENTVLHALMYIFKTQAQGFTTLEDMHGDLSVDLCEAGFEQTVVDQAIEWIIGLNDDLVPEPTSCFDGLKNIGGGVRVYAPSELEVLDVRCRQYLLILEQRGILSPFNRERVIDQTVALHDAAVDVPLLKWVTMMVLYNQPDVEVRSLAEMLAVEEMMVCYH